MNSDRFGATFLTTAMVIAEMLHLSQKGKALYGIGELFDAKKYMAGIIEIVVLGAILVLINFFVSYGVIHRVVFWHQTFDSLEEKQREEAKTAKTAVFLTLGIYAAFCLLAVLL